ncbi:MAG: hypothetical protein WCA08_04440 [Desulfoferrobacter sp.]
MATKLATRLQTMLEARFQMPDKRCRCRSSIFYRVSIIQRNRPVFGQGLNENETILSRVEKLQFGSPRQLLSRHSRMLLAGIHKGAQGWIPAKACPRGL